MMRTKLALLFLSVAAIFMLARPFVRVSVDDFGIAVTVRTSQTHKFQPAFVWQFGSGLIDYNK